MKKNTPTILAIKQFLIAFIPNPSVYALFSFHFLYTEQWPLILLIFPLAHSFACFEIDAIERMSNVSGREEEIQKTKT